MKKILLIIPILLMTLFLGGCSDQGYIVRNNLEREEQQFKVYRRVVFYNAIQDKYILTVEGYLAVNIDTDGDVVVTIKTENNGYLKHYLGKSAGVVYFSEALMSSQISDTRYKVIFNPAEVIPTIELINNNK